MKESFILSDSEIICRIIQKYFEVLSPSFDKILCIKVVSFVYAKANEIYGSRQNENIS